MSSLIPAFTALKTTNPLVHCITNVVVTNFTANALLAAGASPAMTDIPGEAEGFAAIAHALLINLGTPQAEQREAARLAAASAHAAATPWVLDPVAVGVLPVRTQLAFDLLEHKPTVIRGNASEIAALAGAGAGGRGVDSTLDSQAAVPLAAQLAQQTGAVVALSGPTDFLIAPDGRVLSLSNGSPLLTQVTGGGCALGALIAAYVGACRKGKEPGTGTDPLWATAAAVAHWTLAAQSAAESSQGPGSFAVHLLDAVANMQAEDFYRASLTQGTVADV